MIRHLRQVKPQCLIYSLAMVLNTEPDEIIKHLGHDGLRKIYLTPKKWIYQGVHRQEAFYLAYQYYGVSLILFETDPKGIVEGNVIQLNNVCGKGISDCMINMMKHHKAVLIGQYKGKEHAVAYEEGCCYDPNGYIYTVDNFVIREAWFYGESFYDKSTGATT